MPTTTSWSSRCKLLPGLRTAKTSATHLRRSLRRDNGPLSGLPDVAFVPRSSVYEPIGSDGSHALPGPKVSTPPCHQRVADARSIERATQSRHPESADLCAASRPAAYGYPAGANSPSSSVARWAHNPEVGGSNPAPATSFRRSRPFPGRERAFCVSDAVAKRVAATRFCAAWRRDRRDGVARNETAWTWRTMPLGISGCLAQKYRQRAGARAGPARTRTHAGMRLGGVSTY